MPRDTTFCICPTKYWERWEAAALINTKQRTSKHKVPRKDYDGKLPDEDICPIRKKPKSAQDMDLDAETDCVLGMGHNVHVSPLPLTDSASQCSTRPAEVSEKKRKIAEVVAAATKLVSDSIRWRCLPRGFLSKHRRKVWRSIMKSVMSVIDVDLINVEASNTRDCEYQKLLSKLNSFVRADEVSEGEAEFCKKYFNYRKFQGQVIDSIADDDGTFIAEDFAGLIEGDVPDLIERMGMVTESTVSAWRSGCLEGKAPERMVEVALEEMETFLPLKEDREMQLALELSRGRCFHAQDYLFVEACKGFMSEEFFKDLDEMLVKSNRTSEDVLSYFAESLYEGLHELAYFKYEMLRFSEEGITRRLIFREFGSSFSDDAIGVIKIANHERRRRGGRFIGLRDILFGLSCAGYLNNFNDMGLRELPEMPPYRFYRLAGELALEMGAKSVQVGHLVGAFLKIAEQHQQADEFIRRMYFDESKRGPGLMFLEIKGASLFTDTYEEKGLLHNGKPILGFKALISAFREGLELPDIRMEHRSTGSGPYFRPMDLCI